MENFDYSNFYSGGFFLLRSNRPDWPPPFGEFLPDGNLISLARCICPQRLNVSWGWKTGNRQAAVEFGIPEDQLDQFIELCQTGFPDTIGLGGMFHSLDTARDFVSRFQLDLNNLYLIETALPEELHHEWLEEVEDDEGIAKRIKQAIPVHSTGRLLGYDVVSFSYHDFAHSWHCNYLDHKMKELFGTQANRDGLLDSYADAKQIYEWIIADPASRAEPEPYDFWAILSYPLSI